MAGRIYSVHFPLTGDSPTLSHYDVPAGFVGVLRDCRFTIDRDRAFSTAMALQLRLDDGADIIWAIDGTFATPGTYTWLGHQVFSTLLQLETWPIAWSFRASGYLLKIP